MSIDLETEFALQFTQDALALEFVRLWQHGVRYVQSTSPYKWFVCDADGNWEPDNTNEVLSLVREICREAARRCDDTELALTICSAAGISAVERLARSDRRIATTREGVGLPPPKKRGKAGVG